jgi:hypothetical protein
MTVEHEDLTLSIDAVELLACYRHGVHKIVSALAEEFARKRSPAASPVVVDVEDVRLAAEKVSTALQQVSPNEDFRKFIVREMHPDECAS